MTDLVGFGTCRLGEWVTIAVAPKTDRKAYRGLRRGLDYADSLLANLRNRVHL